MYMYILHWYTHMGKRLAELRHCTADISIQGIPMNSLVILNAQIYSMQRGSLKKNNYYHYYYNYCYFYY